MKILVIDGQGGRLGCQLVERIKRTLPAAIVFAVGTNSVAASMMRKSGADEAATGENAVRVCASRVDVIVGPIGIVIADSMLGEITPAIAVAVGQSSAKKLLLPWGRCGNLVVGAQGVPVAELLDQTMRMLAELEKG